MTMLPYARRYGSLCALWATTLRRLPRQNEFLNSEQVEDTSCLITDVQMPGLSGLDLQDLLIARGDRIPIIFLTGYPDENVRTRAMKAGAIGFLIKPPNHHDLVDHLETALKTA